MPETKPIVDQQTIILRNVARWREEQAAKQAKQAKLTQQAAERGLSLAQFKQAKREKYLLANARATIGQIVAAHKKG